MKPALCRLLMTFAHGAIVRCFCSYLQCYCKDNVFKGQYGSVSICIYMVKQFAGLHKPSHGLGTGTATGPGGWPKCCPFCPGYLEGAKKMSPELLTILNDRIDRLHRHGRFEECAIAERERDSLFPKEKYRPDQSEAKLKREMRVRQ